MSKKFCPQCGEKLDVDSNFCINCGFKVNDAEKRTKFCHDCGEKIDFNAKICPKCGVRVSNLLSDLTSNDLDEAKDEFDTSGKDFKEIFRSKRFIIAILVVIFLILLVSSPYLIQVLTPYKEVGSDYFSNPIPGEKVKFTGEYIGTTNWNLGIMDYYNDYDIVKVGDYYIFIQGSPKAHNLSGYEGHTIYLEGKFPSTEKSTEPTENGNIIGYWFSPHKIRIID